MGVYIIFLHFIANFLQNNFCKQATLIYITQAE